MEYKVISFQNVFSASKALANLIKAVNEAIALGWEPLGGIAVTGNGVVAQAIVKRR